MDGERASRHEPERGLGSLAPGILIGMGIAGTLDEVLLHQLLHWHHFYTGSSRATGLVTDGLFHLFSTAVLVAGLVLTHRRGVPPARPLAGAILAGAGGFNLYDSAVQHKLLDLHQVREDTGDLLPYDLVFTAVAAVALAAGLMLLRRPSR